MTVDIPSLAILAQSNGLALEELIQNIEGAINERYSELQEAEPGVQSRMDRTTGVVSLFKIVDGLEVSVTGPVEFPRIATGVIRKTLKGKLREVKDAEIVQEFSTTIGDLVSGVVQQGRDNKVILVNIGPVEGKIPLQEQVPTENFVHGDRIKALIVDVRQGNKGPEIVLSRTHPNLIKKLFALEVPEIDRWCCRNYGSCTRSRTSHQNCSARSPRWRFTKRCANWSNGTARAKCYG